MDKQIYHSAYIRFGIYLPFLSNAPDIVNLRLYVEDKLGWDGINMTTLEFFKLLSDETRLLSLLLIIAERELCVCELMQALDESQPKVSRHLAQMRKAGLLLDKRQGQWVFYRVNPELPDWINKTLSELSANNNALISSNINRLHKMGERPERVRACCN